MRRHTFCTVFFFRLMKLAIFGASHLIDSSDEIGTLFHYHLNFRWVETNKKTECFYHRIQSHSLSITSFSPYPLQFHSADHFRFHLFACENPLNPLIKMSLIHNFFCHETRFSRNCQHFLGRLSIVALFAKS